MTRVDVGRLNQCQIKGVDMTLGTKFGQREMKMDHPPSQRLSVRVQLRIAFFLIFAAFLGVSLLVDDRMRIINAKSTEMAANWMPSIVAVNAINTATSDMRTAEALHILSNEDAEMGQQEELIARLAKEIADQRTKYKALISSEEERALYQSFTRKYDEYLEASKRSMALSRRNQNTEAAAQLKASGLVFDSMSDELVKLVKLNTEGGESASTQGDVVYSESRTLLLWIGGGTFLLVLVLPWVLERRILPRASKKLPGDALARAMLSVHYRKPALLLIGATFVSVVSAAYFSNRLFSGLTLNVEQEQLNLVRSAVDNNLQAAQARALSRAEAIADLPRARALLAARDRPGLLAEFGRMFQTQADKYGASQAQFHVAPATSFLNLHAPESFGDDLTKSRPMIVTTSRDRLPQAGFSITTSGPGIFGVAPMFDSSNRHIGSFETGVSIEDFGDGLKSALNLEVAIFIDEDALWENAKGLDKAVFSAQNRAGQYIRYHSTNASLMKELVSTSDLNDPQAQYGRKAGGSHYGVVMVPIRMGSGEVKGVIAAAKDMGSLRADEGRAVVWQALMAVTSIVFLSGLILIVVRGVLSEAIEARLSLPGDLRSSELGTLEAAQTQPLSPTAPAEPADSPPPMPAPTPALSPDGGRSGS